jgi:hypothetical protein
MCKPLTTMAPGKFTVPRKVIEPPVIAPAPSRLTVIEAWNLPVAFNPCIGGTSFAEERLTTVVTVSALAEVETAKRSNTKREAVNPTVLFIVFFLVVIRANEIVFLAQ